ncbi:MAG: helix-turn-helix transcriptional regulator [Holophagaceae bacterium]|nr:helix-turn-helix transcriptional regulator [Holophagaceae bacterium]
MVWDLEPSIRPLLRTGRLFVGEWKCPGERRPWARETSPSLEVEFPRTGMHLRSIAGRRTVVDPCRYLVHQPGEEYLMASPSGRPQQSTILRLTGEGIEALGISPGSGTYRIQPAIALLHAAFLAEPDPLGAEELAGALVEQALRQAAGVPRRSGTTPLPPSWRRLAADLEEVIALRYSERLTLEDLAGGCGVSPFHASRVFRAVTGTTIHQHLNQARLRAALLAMRAEAGKLSSLALNLGFSSHSHFTFAFRKEYGRSPAAWLAGPKPPHAGG